MKCFCVQIHLEKSPEIDEKKLIRLFNKLCETLDYVSSIDIDKGFDSEQYLNINCRTCDLKTLWNQIRAHFYEHKEFGPALAKASIVVCEGKNGWDDYLLLFHYDGREKVDSL